MTSVNTFPGVCVCGQLVQVGHGETYQHGSLFRVRCATCSARSRLVGQPAGPPPTVKLGVRDGRVRYEVSVKSGWAYTALSDRLKALGAELDWAGQGSFSSTFESASQIVASLQREHYQLDVLPELPAAVYARIDATKNAVATTNKVLEDLDQAMKGRGKFLRGYQKVGAAWLAARGPREGGVGALLADSCGLGKTVIALAAVPPSAPCLVICPGGARGVWSKHFEEWRPEFKVTVVKKPAEFRWPERGEVAIVSYDTIRKCVLNGWPAEGTVSINDECFPPQALVDTPTGPTQIVSICPGDHVFSAAGVARVRRVIKSPAPHVVAVVYTGLGRRVECTINHRFFTGRGWVTAINLERGDRLVGVYAGMRLVWGKFREVPAKAFLRDELLSEMEDEAAFGARRRVYERGCSEGELQVKGSLREGQELCSGLVRTYEGQESNAERDHSKKGGSHTFGHELGSGLQGRQWDWANADGEDSARSHARIDVECRREDHEKAWLWLPSGVQAGSWHSMANARSGAGRADAQFTNGESARQEEDGLAGVDWVDRVEIQERRRSGSLGRGRGYDLVYNLEVEGHPSYSVEGLLVHNCHRAKNPKSQQTQKVRATRVLAWEKHGCSWGLTATPILNQPGEFWEVGESIGVARESFRTFHDLVTAFGGRRRRGRPGYDWPEKVPAEAARRIQIVSLRREKKDVLKELPPKVHETIEIEIPKGVKKELDLVCKKALASIEERGLTIDQALEKLVGSAGQGFEELAQAYKVLALAKIPALLELVEDFEDAHEPLVVFSAHVGPVEALRARKGWGTIADMTTACYEADRVTKLREPVEAEELFQTGKLQNMAGTIAAMGTVYTLTRASNEIFVDLPWTPALLDQAEDRLVRLGQTRGVVVRRLVFPHPLDQKKIELLDKKRAVIEGSVGASTVSPDAPIEIATGPLEKLYKLISTRP